MRRQNVELTNKLVNIRSLEAHCEIGNNNNNNNNSNIDSELGSNHTSPPLPSIDPLPPPPSAPIPSQTHALVEGTEVVNNRELIITNFVDADIADYKKVSFVVLVALVPPITISDIILARPLSLPPAPVEQSNQPRSRRAVLCLSRRQGAACKVGQDSYQHRRSGNLSAWK